MTVRRSPKYNVPWLPLPRFGTSRTETPRSVPIRLIERRNSEPLNTYSIGLFCPNRKGLASGSLPE